MENLILYEFHDGVRDVLQGSILAPKAMKILNIVSIYIEQRCGVPTDFLAYVEDGYINNTIIDYEYLRPFAKISIDVLTKFGYKNNRLQLEFSDKDIKKLYELAQKSDSNRTAVLRNAMKFYNYILEQIDEGNQVQLNKIASIKNFIKSIPKYKISIEHFVLFNDLETTQIILEDSFALEFYDESINIYKNVYKINFPYQNEVIEIMFKCCLSRKNDIISLQKFLLNELYETSIYTQIRYKAMIWFIYLVIEIVNRVEIDRIGRGVHYIKTKFKELLIAAIEDKLISIEEFEKSYDDGLWDGTMFVYLQGADRRKFAKRLFETFNFNNSNRVRYKTLLSTDRNCIYKEVYKTFMKKKDYSP